MTRELDLDPDHPILPEAWRHEVVGFRLDRIPEDGTEAYLDLTLMREGRRRRLRFWSPRDIQIERGGPCITFGLVISDLQSRGLEDVGVRVDDFEASQGAVRFVARAVEDLDE